MLCTAQRLRRRARPVCGASRVRHVQALPIAGVRRRLQCAVALALQRDLVRRRNNSSAIRSHADVPTQDTPSTSVQRFRTLHVALSPGSQHISTPATAPPLMSSLSACTSFYTARSPCRGPGRHPPRRQRRRTKRALVDASRLVHHCIETERRPKHLDRLASALAASRR